MVLVRRRSGVGAPDGRHAREPCRGARLCRGTRSLGAADPGRSGDLDPPVQGRHRRDPGFAPAYAGLAEAWLIIGEYGGVVEADAFRRARHYARTALRLDPELPAAYRALGFVDYWWRSDRAGALAEFRRAIALDAAIRRDPRTAVTVLIDHGRQEIARGERKLRETPAFYASSMGDRAALIALLREANDQDERWYAASLTRRIARRWHGDAQVERLLAGVLPPEKRPES